MKLKSDNIYTSGIEYFFNPKSIAIVGASKNLTKFGGRPISALLKKKYTGTVYPINGRYKEIAGLTCYPSVHDVPGEIDFAIISVPIERTLEALQQCAEKGVKAAVVFTSGFAETGDGGGTLQEGITKIATRSGMRILGPNCMGLLYYRNSIMASFTPIVEYDIDAPPALSLITQSGAYGEKVFIAAIQEGIGFSSFISVGNEADLQFSDFITHLLNDEDTRLFGVYLEAVRDGLKFRQAAEAALRVGKPILIKKVGKTKAGKRAAISHTGSLVGNDRLYDAFFRQTGIIRFEEVRELMYFTLVHRSGRMPKGRNVGILTDSGGPGVDFADRCEEFGLNVPELSETTRAKIKEVIPFYGSVHNPVDMTAAILGDHELYGKCLRAIFEADNIDIIFASAIFMKFISPKWLDEALEIYHSSSKPLVFCPVWTDLSPQSQAMIARVRKEGIPMIPESSDAARAMAFLARYAEKRKSFMEITNKSSEIPPEAMKKAKSILQKTEVFTEYESKKILAAYGIPVTKEDLAASVEEAVAVARRIGYPVALKVLSPDVAHKTEAGGVSLNLKDDGAVREAYARIMRDVKKHAPGAVISGVLVQEMLGEGVEVIVGVTRDPFLGSSIMFGLGGILVEVLHDVSFRLVPLTVADAKEMISEIKGTRILAGVRGRSASDVNALIDVILKVSQLAIDFADQIEELDINPLIVFPQGVRVADALIVKKK